MTDRYFIKTIKNEKQEGFGGLTIEIWSNMPSMKVGEYKRNYHTNFNCFQYFQLEGNDYCIISGPSYQITKILSLPDCKEVCVLQNKFCPTDFWIPQYIEYIYPNWELREGQTEPTVWRDYEPDCFQDEDDEKKEIVTPLRYADFGFAAGCYWGDDSGGDKVQYIDLSKLVSEGKAVQDDRFGYHQLPPVGHNCNPYESQLRKHIELGTEHPDWIQFEINTSQCYRKKGDRFITYNPHDNGDWKDAQTGEASND